MENAHLTSDLGLDSMDVLNLVMEIEDCLDIRISMEKLNPKKSQASVLEVMQISYQIKYN